MFLLLPLDNNDGENSNGKKEQKKDRRNQLFNQEFLSDAINFPIAK